MPEHTPRSKVATYYVWPDGARFATSGCLAWCIENGWTGGGAFEVGEDLDVTLGSKKFGMKFAGTFAKEGTECPVVSFGQPPLGYYMLGAWSDAGDEDFPPLLVLHSACRRLDAPT